MELALQALRRLHILEDSETPAILLNRNFQKSIKRALTGGGSHNSFGVPVDPVDLIGDEDVDVAFLDAYANDSWEVRRVGRLGSVSSHSIIRPFCTFWSAHRGLRSPHKLCWTC